MGWTYNTVDSNSPTDAGTIIAVGASFTAVALVIVCLRIYVRICMIHNAAIDDWTIVTTWFLSTGFLVVTTLQTRWGLGLRDLNDMPTANYFNFGLLQFWGAPFYILGILGFKLSLLFSFLRIAVEQSHRIGILILIAACTAFNFSFLMAQVNLCTPIAKQWDPSITTGSCLVAVPMYTTMASLTIVFDVLIMLAPFPMLLKSRLQPRKKAVILGLFSLGIFITIIQIVRIQTIKALSNAIASGPLIMWSMVEINLGIIVASIPPLSPLIRSFRELSSRNRSKQTNQSLAITYALQSITAGNRERDGHIVLGTGHDTDSKEHNVVVSGGRIDNSSEEFIFPGSSQEIYQKTEVIITEQRKG